MNEANKLLLGEIIACRQLVEDYASRLDAACTEYYERGKTEFPNLSRAENEDIDQQCELLMSHLTPVMPDVMNRWQSIKYPINQYDQMVERMRDMWVRRRNLIRTLEATVRTTLEFDNTPEPRHENLSGRSDHPAERTSKTTILFLAADPTDASRLRLGQEFREINDSLRKAQMRDAFKLALPQLSVRPSDISQALLDETPRIVHFSGHGTKAGALCFEDAGGKIQAVKASALAALFELVSNDVQCVILNACYSATQAQAITKHISYVIGMSDAIDDQAAVSFAIGFYQALGAGRSIEDAFRFGCVQIRLQGIPEYLTPVLLRKGEQQS